VLIGVSFFEKSLAWPRLWVIYSGATTYSERSTKMDARTNSLLLQLKAKKADELDYYESLTRNELETIQRETSIAEQQIRDLQEMVLKFRGAFDQTVLLYVAYVKSQEEKAK
jgi:hypothetical protein